MKPKGKGQVVVTKGRRAPQIEHAVVVDGQRLVLSGWKGVPFRDHEQRRAGTDLRGARLRPRLSLPPAQGVLRRLLSAGECFEVRRSGQKTRGIVRR